MGNKCAYGELMNMMEKPHLGDSLEGVFSLAFLEHSSLQPLLLIPADFGEVVL